MRARDVAATSLTVVMVMCALLVTWVTVADHFRLHAAPSSKSPRSLVPEIVADWAKYIADGLWIGPRDAPVKVIEFGDFECPVCRAFALNVLDSVRSAHPGQIAVIFRHLPISYHKLAIPAAEAAECAARQGHFEEFYDVLFREQDSLGLKPLRDFAKVAGVQDLTLFDTCLRDGDGTILVKITRAVAAAKVLGAPGTPTILINRYLLRGAPDRELMDSLVTIAAHERR